VATRGQLHRDELNRKSRNTTPFRSVSQSGRRLNSSILRNCLRKRNDAARGAGRGARGRTSLRPLALVVYERRTARWPESFPRWCLEEITHLAAAAFTRRAVTVALSRSQLAVGS